MNLSQRLILKEEIVLRVQLEKQVTSKVVDLLLQLVRDQLDIQK
jgi:hypothetical protein